MQPFNLRMMNLSLLLYELTFCLLYLSCIWSFYQQLLCVHTWFKMIQNVAAYLHSILPVVVKSNFLFMIKHQTSFSELLFYCGLQVQNA